MFEFKLLKMPFVRKDVAKARNDHQCDVIAINELDLSV
jgi:hypothetical protein